MRRRLVAAPMAVGVMLAGTLALVPGTAKASVTAGLGLNDAGGAVTSQPIDAVMGEDGTVDKLVPVVAVDSSLSSIPSDAGTKVNDGRETSDVPSGALSDSGSDRDGMSGEGDVDAEDSDSENSGTLNELDDPAEPAVDDSSTEGGEGNAAAVDSDESASIISPAGGADITPEEESDPDATDNVSSAISVTVEDKDSSLAGAGLTSDEIQLAQPEVAALSESAAAADAAAKKIATVQTYRLYNPNSGEHFYTLDSYERDYLVRAGWRYEGVGWTTVATSSTPVYRLYNPNAGDHHYTTSSFERDHLVSVGWRYEGIGWYSDDAEGTPLYREYNPNAISGAHHFTTDLYERLNIVSAGWRYEGVAWFAVDLGPLAPTDAAPNTWVKSGDARFYIGSNGHAVTGWQSIGGTRYYFDKKGRMSTGLRDIDGTIYNFQSNGAAYKGWASFSGYRYYFNSDGSLRRSGWFVDGGKTYYLDPTSGAMATGTRWIDGYLRPFDSSGACLKTGYQTKWGNLMLAARNVTLPGYAQGSYWSYVHPCTIGADATRAQVIEAFINAAYDYQRAGTRWVDNNCGAPGTTVDCSGLVMESLYAVGMDLTGVAGGDFNPYSKYYWNHHFANTWRLNNTFQPISISQLERGDIIYYSGHVVIYLGNGRILESTPYASNVRESSMYSPGSILGCARPFTK